MDSEAPKDGKDGMALGGGDVKDREGREPFVPWFPPVEGVPW
jgi:hypothetical protein